MEQPTTLGPCDQCGGLLGDGFSLVAITIRPAIRGETASGVIDLAAQTSSLEVRADLKICDGCLRGGPLSIDWRHVTSGPVREITAVVHVAGRPQGAVQTCERCGCILINNVGAQVPVGQPPPGFWPHGESIEVVEGQGLMRSSAPTASAPTCTPAQ